MTGIGNSEKAEDPIVVDGGDGGGGSCMIGSMTDHMSDYKIVLVALMMTCSLIGIASALYSKKIRLFNRQS